MTFDELKLLDDLLFVLSLKPNECQESIEHGMRIIKRELELKEIERSYDKN